MDPLYGQRSSATKPSKDAVWLLIDATNKTLGRMTSEVAMRLQGKHKPIYQPGVVCGDQIVIINADKIYLSGNKAEQKDYYRHSGYSGGLKTRKLKKQMEMSSEKVILDSIKGMLPKTKFGNKLLKRVRVFTGAEHNLQAQTPKLTELKHSKMVIK